MNNIFYTDQNRKISRQRARGYMGALVKGCPTCASRKKQKEMTSSNGLKDSQKEIKH